MRPVREAADCVMRSPENGSDVEEHAKKQQERSISRRKFVCFMT
jgi:hypothetical protein